MKTSPGLFVAAALGSVLVSSTHSGCATKPPMLAAMSEIKQPIVIVEYETVYVTGSYIPVRVPKSSTARVPPTTSPVDVITQEEMRRMPMSGRRPMN